MVLPDYWLQRPKTNLDAEMKSAFDQLLTLVRPSGTNILIEYNLPYPKWQFLCYVADHHSIALHGTGNPNIHIFEPRQSNDLSDFGNQTAVYAAADGLWAMYFAIIDRDRYRMSLNNACIRLVDSNGQISEPRYVFSVSQSALSHRPWRTGFVYLLSSDTFMTQPAFSVGPYEIRVPQLASLVAVTPIARLEVTPDDFPFREDIRGHDDARLHEYAHAMQTAGPWPAI